MKKKNRIPKKLISLLLTFVFILSLLPTVANAESPVVTDSTDFDVFMNIDPSLNIDSTTFKNKVSGYLNTLIGGTGKSYRINTSAATIDPTDITKWEVYDHYDTQWFTNDAAWKAPVSGYHGGVIPSNWYYYPVTDSHYNAANTKTSIAAMLNDKAGNTHNNTYWGGTAGLESHIYAYLENSKPAMQFYGYGTSDWADFLYYPASASSTKTVKFDVDASNVLPHSLKYAGFLINTGTTGTGSSKTMSGYLILFQYGPSGSTTAATTLVGAYLYKLDNINVDDLHAHGLKYFTSGNGWTLLDTSSFNTLYTKSHIELGITSTSLTATVQQIDNSSGALTGPVSYLFGSPGSPETLVDTGYGGFGPYVDFGVTGHSCTNTSSFRYSNLEMAFSEVLSGTSALEAYQYADYLNDSDQRYFVNLTKDGTQNYAAASNDTDKAYLNLMAADKTILITDEYEGTYLPDSLGGNAKSVSDTNHVTDSDIAAIYSGSNPTEVMAAKVAWLIYHSAPGTGGTIGTPTSVAIASLMLLDGPGTADPSWSGANQVNQIKKELMTSSTLNIYLNPDNSQNAGGLTAAYTLTEPSGATTTISPLTDTENGDKLYFTVPKSSAAGEYKVTLTYSTDGVRTTTIPATATFSILTDAVAPTASASISGATAILTLTNTAGAGSTAYTSELDSYAAVVNTTSAQPSAPADFTAVSGNTASVGIGDDLSPATYYLHMFVKDKAGNTGYTRQSFTVSGPAVALTTPASNTYTDSAPYEGDTIAFALSAGTYDIVTYQIGYGNLAPTYGAAIDATHLSSVQIQQPAGVYRLWIKATDAAGNTSSPVSLYVSAKKLQILTGTDAYTLEAGVDRGVTLDYTSASSPALSEGESLGAITYTEASDPNNCISLSGNHVTVNNNTYVGTATITVAAAGNTTHRAATDTIAVNVVKPFSVSLIASGYNASTGVTIVPGYTDEGGFGIGASRELKYRKTGTTDWITIRTADWSWNTPHTLSFSGLAAGTEYELSLSGQNGRTTPTTSNATLTFKTPEPASSGTGTGTVIIKDTDNGEPYYVSIRSGDTVVQSDTVTGDGSDKSYTFSSLPDGFYNIVVEHDGEIVTKTVEINGGIQSPGSLSVKLTGETNTRVTVANDITPRVAADGLDGLYGATVNTDDSAGITASDNTILNAGGSAVIELIATGLKESDAQSDVAKINTIKNGQSLAMLVDLSLYKTVRENNAVSGVTNRLTSTSKLITVAVPFATVSGTALKAYRVHGNTAQIIPAAIFDNASGNYVWADTYNTYIKGSAVGPDDEFVVFEDGWAVFHVSKFSTYAIGYTPYASAVTYTASVVPAKNGTVSASPEKQQSGSPVKLTVTPDEGYELAGLNIKDAYGNTITWTRLSDGTYQFTMPYTAVTIDASFVRTVSKPTDTGVADWLITADHISYMFGDDHGYFRPDKNMTRAEAAQLFYNLLLDKNVKITASFSDLPENAWYKKAVETLASLGVITGYNGLYRPEDNITRAEFAVIAMRFAKITDGNASFSDVPGTYWAYKYIMSAAGYGWVNGFADGTFRPQVLITRAEVATIVNNMLGRSADRVFVDSNRANLKMFPDVTSNSYWAYYDIFEATNKHDPSITDGRETWTHAG